MKLLHALLVALFNAAIVAPQSNPHARPTAYTHHGQVQGVHVHNSVNAFLGIPYAKPPVGPLRFKPPQPLPSQPQQYGTLDASHFGPVCHQFHYRTVLGDLLLETSAQSEDCLTLNVFVPRHSNTTAMMPVFVWSHGGGFAEGGGSVPIFDPKGFVAENKDIIVVTWNYRLNIFGFPNSPALSSQNLGLRDQRAALEWLRHNIAAFGGDPQRIILGGQSAGADSASAMAYSHADDPIFSALALQSGTVQVIGAVQDDVDSEFVRVAGLLGCADAEDRSKELECMRRVEAEELQNAVSNTNSTFHLFGSPAGGTPMVDNVTVFSPVEYIRRGSSGKFANVPVLMGSMNSEGDSVLNWSEKCGVNKTLAQLGTKDIFTCNVALEAGFRQTNNVPVWRYRYMGVFPEVTPYPWLGAYHQADFPMLMGTFHLFSSNPSENTKEASRYLQHAFGSFIRDPAQGLTKVYGWPTYSPGNMATTIELFPDSQPLARLESSAPYDQGCETIPMFPWLDVLRGPPKC